MNEKHKKCGEKWHVTIRNKKFVGYDDNGKEIYQVVDEEEGGYNYNFAISKWLFIHSQAPNYYIGDSKKKIIGLGGLSKKSVKLLKLTNCYGFAGISYFKQKKGP